MSSYNFKLFIFSLVFRTFLLPFVLSSPIPNSPYDKFINFLTEKKCIMPKEIKLPFSELSEPSSFNYLSTPLSECRTNDALEEYSEAYMLCTEIFDVLKNITCANYSKPLPKIESDNLSEDVCHDFESFKNILPLNENYLSGRLSDKLICKVMCSAEKYEVLCKTLLWSYDTLSKIKYALSTEEEKEQTHGNDNTGEVPVAPNKATSSVKGNSVSEITQPTSQINKELDKSKDINPNSNKENLLESNLNQTNQESQNLKTTDVASKTVSQNVLTEDLSNPRIQNEAVNKTSDSTKYTASTVQQSQSESENKKLFPVVTDNTVAKPTESKQLFESNPQSEHRDDIENKSNDNENEIDDEGKLPKKEMVNTDSQASLGKTRNEIDVEGKLPKKEKVNADSQANLGKTRNEINVEEKLPKKEKEMVNTDSQSSLGKTSLTPNISGIKDNQDIKNATVANLLNKGNDDVGLKQVKDDNNAGTKTSEKSLEPVGSATEKDNELKDGYFPEEDEKSKAKQTDVENQVEKEIEKPKQSDYHAPNEIVPDNDSKLSESFTQSVFSDDDMEHQEDKEQDQFDDIENESEYAKPEYDNSFNIPPKNKETEIKNSIAAGSNQLTNSYSSNISPKENIGQISGDIAVFAPFPEQEDSHFFFYFLSIVLIIMAGYLIFHNKQKIIALIVEGRHERRRRSGVGYKKLETK